MDEVWLEGADFNKADLSNANLGADVYLGNVTLQDTVIPDGSIVSSEGED